jgi:phage head maturation protease
VEKDSWDKKGDKVIRTIEQVRDLFEISIVSLPAYEATELVKRNFEEFAEDINEAIPEGIADGIFPQTILKHL